MAEQNHEKLSGEVKLSSPFLKKLDNLWYHHKWQLIVGLLLLVVVAVSLVQCVGNGKGDDAYVMYAGGHTMSATARQGFTATIESFCEDRNGDGKIVVALGNYPIYTNEEIKNYNSAEQGHVKEMSFDNRNLFDQEILAGEATLCFLAPHLFEDVAAAGGLLPLADYYTTPDGVTEALYGTVAYGVKLADLPLGGYPGFSSLPKDTIVCVRTKTSLGLLGDKKKHEAMHEANLALAKRLLAAEAYSGS